ncbi:hypothetical protein CHS0354_000430 [Potamilus streckersoni]|uniref:Biopolymer transporter ExbD n=1 Tax=Potamilus streckersoni TaxID=2493646 RepID=A0AAE0W8Y0_9BIVA|nr:hypothetical protein CHS0354_000430 [Potamilus streckersoni]
MAQIKAKRVGFVLDMAPMVDVAFLLLTFFMLTTQFRPPEPVEVMIPSSNSEIKIPESNVLVLTVSREGHIYLGVAEQGTREGIFDQFVKKRLQGMSEDKIADSLKRFKLTESFRVYPNELEEAVIAARLSNPKMRPIIRSDVEAEFKDVDLIMQMSAGVSEPHGGHRRGKKKRRKRLGFTLDMAPMVDVAFLLLTFFMLTTTFSKPSTMEITMPKKDVETKIAESNLLTYSILRGDSVFWSRGQSVPEYVPLYEVVEGKKLISNQIKAIVKEQRQEVINEISEDNLAVVLKFDKRSRYRNLVDMIDELNLMDMKRFSLSALSEEDKNRILNPQTSVEK